MRRAKIERRKEVRSLKEHSRSFPLFPFIRTVAAATIDDCMHRLVLRATLKPAALNACAVAKSLSTDKLTCRNLLCDTENILTE
ncbi:hypothetical protein Ddc_07379 [Ditylenchus destructor]|nr:hypothetical protein Ddc_07379 [Ditylenchus destructor]